MAPGRLHHPAALQSAARNSLALNKHGAGSTSDSQREEPIRNREGGERPGIGWRRGFKPNRGAVEAGCWSGSSSAVSEWGKPGRGWGPRGSGVGLGGSAGSWAEGGGSAGLRFLTEARWRLSAGRRESRVASRCVQRYLRAFPPFTSGLSGSLCPGRRL